MDTHEVLRRRDVVVDERHSIRQGIRNPRRLRPEREMVKQQMIGMADINELSVIARQRLETRVCRFDEDVGLISGGSKHALYPKHLVTDSVSVSQGC